MDINVKHKNSQKTEKAKAKAKNTLKVKKENVTKNKAECAARGVRSMKAIQADRSLFNNVIGFRELRSKISEVIENVITGYNVVISGNIKKNSTKTAAIISTKILEDILNVYRFNPVINFDSETNQYEVILNEISIYAYGDTREEAIDMAIDMAIDITEDYFNNAEMYARIAGEKAKYPYFLRIRNCSNIDEVKKVLGLVQP